MNEPEYNDNYLNNMYIEKIIGNYLIKIKPGGYCVFNEEIPSNGRHYHSCFELCFITSGSGKYIHDNQIYEIKANDVFIADPEKIHEITIKDINPCKLNLVYFLLDIEGKKEDKTNNKIEILIRNFLTNHEIKINAQKHLKTYLDFIEDYNTCLNNKNNNFGNHQAIQNMIFDSLLSLTKGFRYSENTPKSIFDKTIEYINENIYNKIKIKDIADYCNTSKRNLYYHFEKNLNMTITEYINKKKMSIAASYLRMNIEINKISSMIGINSPSQFSRLFKKIYGIPPKKYQNKVSSASYTIFKNDN